MYFKIQIPSEATREPKKPPFVESQLRTALLGLCVPVFEDKQPEVTPQSLQHIEKLLEQLRKQLKKHPGDDRFFLDSDRRTPYTKDQMERMRYSFENMPRDPSSPTKNVVQSSRIQRTGKRDVDMVAYAIASYKRDFANWRSGAVPTAKARGPPSKKLGAPKFGESKLDTYDSCSFIYYDPDSVPSYLTKYYIEVTDDKKIERWMDTLVRIGEQCGNYPRLKTCLDIIVNNMFRTVGNRYASLPTKGVKPTQPDPSIVTSVANSLNNVVTKGDLDMLGDYLCFLPVAKDRTAKKKEAIMQIVGSRTEFNKIEAANMLVLDRFSNCLLDLVLYGIKNKWLPALGHRSTFLRKFFEIAGEELYAREKTAYLTPSENHNIMEFLRPQDRLKREKQFVPIKFELLEFLKSHKRLAELIFAYPESTIRKAFPPPEEQQAYYKDIFQKAEWYHENQTKEEREKIGNRAMKAIVAFHIDWSNLNWVPYAEKIAADNPKHIGKCLSEFNEGVLSFSQFEKLRLIFEQEEDRMKYEKMRGLNPAPNAYSDLTRELMQCHFRMCKNIWKLDEIPQLKVFLPKPKENDPPNTPVKTKISELFSLSQSQVALQMFFYYQRFRDFEFLAPYIQYAKVQLPKPREPESGSPPEEPSRDETVEEYKRKWEKKEEKEDVKVKFGKDVRNILVDTIREKVLRLLAKKVDPAHLPKVYWDELISKVTYNKKFPEYAAALVEYAAKIGTEEFKKQMSVTTYVLQDPKNQVVNILKDIYRSNRKLLLDQVHLIYIFLTKYGADPEQCVLWLKDRYFEFLCKQEVYIKPDSSGTFNLINGVKIASPNVVLQDFLASVQTFFDNQQQFGKYYRVFLNLMEKIAVEPMVPQNLRVWDVSKYTLAILNFIRKSMVKNPNSKEGTVPCRDYCHCLLNYHLKRIVTTCDSQEMPAYKNTLAMDWVLMEYAIPKLSSDPDEPQPPTKTEKDAILIAERDIQEITNLEENVDKFLAYPPSDEASSRLSNMLENLPCAEGSSTPIIPIRCNQFLSPVFSKPGAVFGDQELKEVKNLCRNVDFAVLVSSSAYPENVKALWLAHLAKEAGANFDLKLSDVNIYIENMKIDGSRIANFRTNVQNSLLTPKELLSLPLDRLAHVVFRLNLPAFRKLSAAVWPSASIQQKAVHLYTAIISKSMKHVLWLVNLGMPAIVFRDMMLSNPYHFEVSEEQLAAEESNELEKPPTPKVEENNDEDEYDDHVEPFSHKLNVLIYAILNWRSFVQLLQESLILRAGYTQFSDNIHYKVPDLTAAHLDKARHGTIFKGLYYADLFEQVDRLDTDSKLNAPIQLAKLLTTVREACDKDPEFMKDILSRSDRVVNETKDYLLDADGQFNYVVNFRRENKSNWTPGEFTRRHFIMKDDETHVSDLIKEWAGEIQEWNRDIEKWKEATKDWSTRVKGWENVNRWQIEPKGFSSKFTELSNQCFKRKTLDLFIMRVLEHGSNQQVESMLKDLAVVSPQPSLVKGMVDFSQNIRAVISTLAGHLRRIHSRDLSPYWGDLIMLKTTPDLYQSVESTLIYFVLTVVVFSGAKTETEQFLEELRKRGDQDDAVALAAVQFNVNKKKIKAVLLSDKRSLCLPLVVNFCRDVLFNNYRLNMKAEWNGVGSKYSTFFETKGNIGFINRPVLSVSDRRIANNPAIISSQEMELATGCCKLKYNEDLVKQIYNDPELGGVSFYNTCLSLEKLADEVLTTRMQIPEIILDSIVQSLKNPKNVLKVVKIGYNQTVARGELVIEIDPYKEKTFILYRSSENLKFYFNPRDRCNSSYYILDGLRNELKLKLETVLTDYGEGEFRDLFEQGINPFSKRCLQAILPQLPLEQKTLPIITYRRDIYSSLDYSQYPPCVYYHKKFAVMWFSRKVYTGCEDPRIYRRSNVSQAFNDRLVEFYTEIPPQEQEVPVTFNTIMGEGIQNPNFTERTLQEYAYMMTIEKILATANTDPKIDANKADLIKDNAALLGFSKFENIPDSSKIAARKARDREIVAADGSSRGKGTYHRFRNKAIKEFDACLSKQKLPQREIVVNMLREYNSPTYAPNKSKGTTAALVPVSSQKQSASKTPGVQNNKVNTRQQIEKIEKGESAVAFSQSGAYPACIYKFTVSTKLK